MNGSLPIRGVVLVVLLLAALSVSVVTENGQYIVIAAVCSMTLYEGIRSGVVYGSMALLLSAELLSGGDVGVMLIPYCIVVPLVVGLRRFIALPTWAASEGWDISDAVRAVGSSWLMSLVMVLLAIGTGDMLFGYAHASERIRAAASVRHLTEMLTACAVTIVVWRRASVPFRTVIRFGS
jgi:hypothetical protein